MVPVARQSIQDVAWRPQSKGYASKVVSRPIRLDSASASSIFPRHGCNGGTEVTWLHKLFSRQRNAHIWNSNSLFVAWMKFGRRLILLSNFEWPNPQVLDRRVSDKVLANLLSGLLLLAPRPDVQFHLHFSGVEGCLHRSSDIYLAKRSLFYQRPAGQRFRRSIWFEWCIASACELRLRTFEVLLKRLPASGGQGDFYRQSCALTIICLLWQTYEF